MQGQTPASLPDGIVHYIRERADVMPECGHTAIAFDDYLWNQLPDNSKLDGLFQNMKYIVDRKDDIREWLKHNVNITEYSSDDICVIHFRGGEYLITASWCPPEYYANARDRMLEINPNMKFVVVTDDPENAHKFIPWATVVGATTLDEQEDIEQGTVEIARRDTLTKDYIAQSEVVSTVKMLLNEIQNNLLERARAFRDSHITEVDTYDEFKELLDSKGGFLSAHWDGTSETEEQIKKETKATIRCIPLDNKEESGYCIYSGNPSSQRVLFAKAY